MPARRNPDGTLDALTSHVHLESGLRVDVSFVEVDGRLVPARIEVGADLTDPAADDPQPITTTVWRSIPIGRVVDEALAAQVGLLRGLEVDPRWNESEASRELRASADEAVGKRRPGRPPLYGPEHYKQVAAEYRKGGRAATEAVRKHFGVTKSTAAKWVARARDDGLIPPWETREG